MNKKKIGIATILALGTSFAKGTTNPSSEIVLESQKNINTINFLNLKLTDEQRVDLLRVLNEMGAQIGDWQTYSDSAAPSRCTARFNECGNNSQENIQLRSGTINLND